MHPSLCVVDLIGEGDRKGEIEFILKYAPAVAVNRMKEAPQYIELPALPSMKTINALIPEEERSLFSHSIEAIAEEGAIRSMLISVADRYPYPADLSEFAYASALASAHKIGEKIRDARLMKDGFGRAVFSRLCDSEPRISSSAIDCRGRWKPLQYYSSNHFAPVALYAFYRDGQVNFSVSNNRRDDVVGTLEFAVKDSSNKVIYSGSSSVNVQPMSMSEIYSERIFERIKGHEREYYLEYYLKEGSFTLSKKTMLFAPEKHFIFKKPKIKSVISGEGDSFSVTISSDSFMKDMEIGFDGIDAIFSHNYIDITSEAPVRITIRVKGGLETTYRLKDALEIRSVGNLIK
jgi:beta-mannosidase